MLPLRRLLGDRVERLLAVQDVVILESGEAWWRDEEEYREEASKLLRVDRIVLSLYRLLNEAWPVGTEGGEAVAQLAA